jgi:biopolymer transport protein ExbB
MPRFLLGFSAICLWTGSVSGGENLPARAWDSFEKGGSVMWAILLASVVGMAFALERVMALRTARQLPATLTARVRDILASDGLESARAMLFRDGSALARVLGALLARSGASRRELETAIEDEGGRVLFDLRRNLRPVALVASVAPLLGLLGTVFGLIGAFGMAAELGMDDPRNFATGIYEALYTTAFGLVVAIPFMVAHHALKARTDGLMRSVEDEAVRFVLDASRARPAARAA